MKNETLTSEIMEDVNKHVAKMVKIELEQHNKKLVEYLKAKLITAKKTFTKTGHDAGYILGREQTINDIEFFNNTKHLRK